MPIYYRDKEEFDMVSYEKISKYITLSSDDDFILCLKIVWLTGLRINEIVRLTKRNILIKPDENELTFMVKASKRGLMAYPSFNFDDPFIKEIVAFVNDLKDDDTRLLKRKSTRRYEQLLKELNEQLYPNDKREWIVFHYLRHSRCTYLGHILGANEAEYKSWFGHRTAAFEFYTRARKVNRFRGKIR